MVFKVVRVLLFITGVQCTVQYSFLVVVRYRNLKFSIIQSCLQPLGYTMAKYTMVKRYIHTY